jgi:hypothetical protein
MRPGFQPPGYTHKSGPPQRGGQTSFCYPRSRRAEEVGDRYLPHFQGDSRLDPVLKLKHRAESLGPPEQDWRIREAGRRTCNFPGRGTVPLVTESPPQKNPPPRKLQSGSDRD